MLRSLSLPLALSFLLAGCPYGDGSPCEVPQDCASGLDCCGASSTVRGICRPTGTCSVAFDAGDRDTPPIDATTSDTPDAPESDVPTDAGDDAPEEMDTPPDLDAPTDAGDMADAPELDVPVDG